MAVKFLDNTGLGYFWSKIKAWCNATFAAITHNQASNTINAMTGYSKPSSGSAIATSDSLNSAIGKLEAKVDAVDHSNVVHKTGTEVIGGEKTFKSVYDRTDTVSGILIRHPKLTRGDSLSSTYYWQIALCDNDGVEWEGTGAHGRCGNFLLAYDSQGNSDVRIAAYKNAANNNTIAQLVAGVRADGTTYATAPQTSTSRTDRSDIVTRGFLEDKGYITSSSSITGTAANVTGTVAIANGGTGATTRLNAIKALTNENVSTNATHFLGLKGDWSKVGYVSVADVKTVLGLGSAAYTASTAYVGINGVHYPKHTSIDNTAAADPSSTVYKTSTSFYDKNDQSLADIYYERQNTGASRLTFRCFSKDRTKQAYLYLQCSKDNNTHSVYLGETPATSSNSTEVATTAFVKAQGYLTSHQSLSNYVTLNSAQTISGTKTFTASPVVYNVNPSYIVKDDVVVSGTTPSSNYEQQMVRSVDKNNKTLAALEYRYTTAGTSRLNLICYKKGVTDAFALIGVGYDNSNNWFTEAPTPSTSDNSTKIATTAYVKAQGYLTSHQSLASCVKTSGDQSISGTKTFSGVIVANGSIEKGNRTGSLLLGGGNGWDANTGAHINLYGADTTSNGTFLIQASKGGSYRRLVGSYNGNLTWNGATVSTSSDKRLKDEIDTVSNDILNIWELVNWQQFKFKDAIEEKGNTARLHVGLVAQDVNELFLNENLDICNYGILCYDKWDDEYLEIDGKQILYKAKGDLWTVRYTEALCMEAAYQRRKNKILENRISELEKQVSDMLQILQSLKGAN